MSIPTFASTRRLTLISFCVAVLYIAVDAGVMPLASFAMPIVWSWLGESDGLDTEAQQIAAQAAAHPSAAQPELRRAAWRVGRAFGFASAARYKVAFTGEAKLAESADRVLREAEDDARRFGVAPIVALSSRTLAAGAALPQRIETDEAGLAARIETATTLQHRHLFLAGAQSGVEEEARLVSGEPNSWRAVTLIERHARLSSLEPALWQPLVVPPGADPARRTAAFIAAMATLEQRLVAPP